MKLLVNPKYEQLREYLKHIDTHFHRDGKEIHSGRNVIRTLEVDGLTLCVKRYGTLSLRRKLARSFRNAKGKQAYYRPLLMRERGYMSPDPIAFVRYRRGLFRTDSYFICILSDYKHHLSELLQVAKEERDEITRQFAIFAARLHEDGFLHRDFSADNILYDLFDNRYRFALIDTNSMRCGKAVSIERGCANFARLNGDGEFFALLAQVYAAERKADAELCLRLIEAARKKYQAKKKR